MKKGNKMLRVSVQLPQELLEDAKILAQSNGMSISSLLRYILIKEMQNITNSNKNDTI